LHCAVKLQRIGLQPPRSPVHFLHLLLHSPRPIQLPNNAVDIHLRREFSAQTPKFKGKHRIRPIKLHVPRRRPLGPPTTSRSPPDSRRELGSPSRFNAHVKACHSSQKHNEHHDTAVTNTIIADHVAAQLKVIACNILHLT
jgi:hypothetical protein